MDSSSESGSETGELGLIDLASRLRDEAALSSPLGGYHLDVIQRGKNTILEDDYGFPTAQPSHEHPPRWTDKPLLVSKFIDDLNATEKNDITGARSVFTTKKEQRFVHALECQKFLQRVTKNATDLGMKVNQEKTQLLCTTTAINYEVRAFIEVGGREIVSGDSLKTVGYTFGRCPGAWEHIKAVRRKCGARSGIIKHLKKLKFDPKTLTSIYCSLIRPVLEYSSNVFHTTLTDKQSEVAENYIEEYPRGGNPLCGVSHP